MHYYLHIFGADILGWTFLSLPISGLLCHLFVSQKENQFIKWKTDWNEEKKAIHKNQRNSSIIWFVIFRDQWIQHYFLVKVFAYHFGWLMDLNVILFLYITIFATDGHLLEESFSFMYSLVFSTSFLFIDIHGFFSDLLCEQFL